MVMASLIYYSVLTPSQTHPEFPKKPLTPYFRFFMEKRAKYAKIHPEMSNLDLTKILSKKYKELPEKKKVCLSVCLSPCLFAWSVLSVCPSGCMQCPGIPACLSVCQQALSCLSVCVSVSMLCPVCLPVYVCRFAWSFLSVCLSAHLKEKLNSVVIISAAKVHHRVPEREGVV